MTMDDKYNYTERDRINDHEAFNAFSTPQIEF